MGIVFCIVAFLGAYVIGRASLGRGMAVVLVVGYFYGILRARFLDGFSHFTFDFALLGLYLARLTVPGPLAFPRSSAAVLGWLVVLIGWPVIVLLTGFIHEQHVFIQVVGFRAAVWMLPCLWLGACLEAIDLRAIARALAVLNLAVLPFAVGEYLWGLEPFFPRNIVTEIMYRSKDVAGFSHFRIPGTFSSSAAYGSVMVATVPFLFGLLLVAGRNALDRMVALGGLLAAAYGAFCCGSRTPVAHLIMLAVPGLFAMRRRLWVVGFTVVLGVVVAVVVSRDVRLQRYRTLEDTDLVAERLHGSAHVGVIDLVAKHPLGVGLGGAAGTSIPSFLQHLTRRQIGAENEYARIGLEQGVIGLVFWGAFLFWYFLHRRTPPSPEWRLGVSLMFYYTLISWATAWIGTGLLAAIPGTVLLLIQMGCVARTASRRPPGTRIDAVPASRALVHT
jgi:hypothetical protein